MKYRYRAGYDNEDAAHESLRGQSSSSSLVPLESVLGDDVAKIQDVALKVMGDG